MTTNEKVPIKGWIVEINGSEDGLLLFCPQQPSLCDNLWADDHPSTLEEKQIIIHTPESLEAFARMCFTFGIFRMGGIEGFIEHLKKEEKL